MLSLQMFLSLLQIKLYQKTVKEMRGSGLLGIGQRKGGVKSGEILILSYDRQNDRVISCQSLKGLTIFAKFKKISVYEGLSLSKMRELGIAQDTKDLKRYRTKHPYNPDILSKKKGALIQAVEAIEHRLKQDGTAETKKTQCLPDPG